MIGYIQGQLGILLHEKNSHARFLPQLFDYQEDFLDYHWPKAKRRFFKQNHSGIGHQRSSNNKHLLLATRQIFVGSQVLEDPAPLKDLNNSEPDHLVWPQLIDARAGRGSGGADRGLYPGH